MNCSFNIRYKPRTTRAFTKSDITVYDSAGNTALNALTVYGKSEVVNDKIISAGEGWATVRLADLTWTYSSTYEIFISSIITDMISQVPEGRKGFCSKYKTTYLTSSLNEMQNGNIVISSSRVDSSPGSMRVAIKDTSYTDANVFENSLNGVLLCYQLADSSLSNCIAVKTDNSSGIDGTMAVFETGTPLRGIPDSTVRDVMVWDGSSGEVTKNCGEVDLGTLNYTYDSTYNVFMTSDIDYATSDVMLCAEYEYIQNVQSWSQLQNKQFAAPYGIQIAFKNTDYTDPADFKTAMNGVKLVYELATPTTEQLTSTENASIAGLRTFEPTTHAQNNAQTDMTVDYTIRVPTI